MKGKEKRQREIIKELVCNKVNQVVAYENREIAIESGFAPDECQETHLPGDCPLCGAK